MGNANPTERPATGSFPRSTRRVTRSEHAQGHAISLGILTLVGMGMNIRGRSRTS